MRSSEWKRIATFCALWTAGSLVASAQTFKTLVNFNGTDGASPEFVTLAQGRDGNLWGTTQGGGTANSGTAFRITPSGFLSDIFNFDGVHGAVPFAGVTLGRDNYLYGVTYQGGTNNLGTVFKLSPTGVITVLFNFDGASGSLPIGGLTQGADGNFYGTTDSGGTGKCTISTPGCGTVFKITPSGALTTLYNLTDATGAGPAAALVQATDGNFYGTTFGGGNSPGCFHGCGTVFRMTPTGALTVIHTFRSSDGANPEAALIQGTDGNLYGTTSHGPSSGSCIFTGGCGTVFKMTRGGVLTTLYSFSGPDGGLPEASLVQGTDGNFYGTTTAGGSSTFCTGGCGTIFQITPSGTPMILHTFAGTDGGAPEGGLTQHTNGLFYGTTAGGLGTVFSLDMGLGPFVKTTTTLGKVGSRVQILGTGLTGATSVTFNGTPAATFTIYGDTYMTAIVPSGATTGLVQVTTPTGTLTSNVNFRVAP